MKKPIKAVAPYIHPGFLNFKIAPFEAWERLGGRYSEESLSSEVLAWGCISLGTTYFMEK